MSSDLSQSTGYLNPSLSFQIIIPNYHCKMAQDQELGQEKICPLKNHQSMSQTMTISRVVQILSTLSALSLVVLFQLKFTVTIECNLNKNSTTYRESWIMSYPFKSDQVALTPCAKSISYNDTDAFYLTLETLIFELSTTMLMTFNIIMLFLRSQPSKPTEKSEFINFHLNSLLNYLALIASIYLLTRLTSFSDNITDVLCKKEPFPSLWMEFRKPHHFSDSPFVDALSCVKTMDKSLINYCEIGILIGYLIMVLQGGLMGANFLLDSQ